MLNKFWRWARTDTFLRLQMCALVIIVVSIGVQKGRAETLQKNILTVDSERAVARTLPQLQKVWEAGMSLDQLECKSDDENCSLRGILSEEGMFFALIGERVCQAGDMIDGFMILEIQADKVILFNEETKAVKTLRMNVF